MGNFDCIIMLISACGSCKEHFRMHHGNKYECQVQKQSGGELICIIIDKTLDGYVICVRTLGKTWNPLEYEFDTYL